MTSLVYTRAGSGEPLVLLHGIGSSRQVWDPVVSLLTPHFDVIAVDLAGFGDSPPGDQSPAGLAGSVADLLDELGLSRPHLAGNSLGGWVALELSLLRPLASLTLLSPAGLWERAIPRYCGISLRLTRWLARHGRRPLSRIVATRLGRAVAFAQVHAHPTRITAEYARAEIDAMATCPGFETTLHGTATRFVGGRDLAAPVTVAFGSRDLLLARASWQRTDELPPSTVVEPLAGCGHVPMPDDPTQVVVAITRTARRAIVTM